MISLFTKTNFLKVHYVLYLSLVIRKNSSCALVTPHRQQSKTLQ